MKIRPAHPADRSAIARLDALCFDRPWTDDAWDSEWKRPFCRIWIGESHEGLAGFVVCWHLADQAELVRIAVATQQRARGRGAQLLAHARTRAQLEGCASMCLEVQADNRAALALYARAGFVQTGRRAGYYAGVDALLMRCDLRDSQPSR